MSQNENLILNTPETDDKLNPLLTNSSNSYFFATENFTEPEAARWLKISRITLQRARLRGEIAYARVGGCRVIYTRKHLEDYLTSRERVAFNPCRVRQTKRKAT